MFKFQFYFLSLIKYFKLNFQVDKPKPHILDELSELVDRKVFKYRRHPRDGYIGHRESFKLKFPDGDGEKEWEDSELCVSETWMYYHRVEKIK